MDFEIDMVIQLVEQASSQDLEACQAAIRSGDKDAALAHSDQALAKLGMALEALRAIPRAGQDLGLGSGVF
jgi:hypothetical protein